MNPADLTILTELLATLPDQIFTVLMVFLILLILKDCIK